MSKIPFKVLSRTARIIGRENVASARGAVVELVKNAYDADSSFAFVYIDLCYDGRYEIISKEVADKFLKAGGDLRLLEDLYEFDEKNRNWTCKILPNPDKLNLLTRAFQNLNSIYIIDAGEGMCEYVIRNYWMTIGTDNKEINHYTFEKRVKSGAKGIGRFALDRLGAKCEMYTVFDRSKHAAELTHEEQNGEINGYKWMVDWDDFDCPSKLLDEVEAEVQPITCMTFREILANLHATNYLPSKPRKHLSKSGTILKVYGLRDSWEQGEIDDLFKDLSTLLPPKETNDFSLYLHYEQMPKKYGEVTNPVCDDFDCKLVAKCDEEGKLNVTVIRKEYDVASMPDELFAQKAFQTFPYRKEDFRNGKWEKSYTLKELLPGIATEENWNPIGKFDFTLYYLKRSKTTSVNDNTYMKPLLSSTYKDRRNWLDINGGIKLFRDGFRVRPYGERTGTAYDWLKLGEAKAKSPNALSRGSGYRIEPNSVSGCVRISRISNINLLDKSSREGLQDTSEFRLFCNILREIIHILEIDRSQIAAKIRLYNEQLIGEANENDPNIIRAQKLIENANAENKSYGHQYQTPKASESEDKFALRIAANQINRLREEKRKLEEEQQIMRSMATCGLVLTSFGHEFSGVQHKLRVRCNQLEKLLRPLISQDSISNLEDWQNPYQMIEEIREDDKKLDSWLDFSLNTTKKNKRKISTIDLNSYILRLKRSWDVILNSYQIVLEIQSEDLPILQISELDLDSIFNNLILNSIEAILNSNSANARKICISCTSKEKLVINYSDSGPGISPDINNKYRIFDALFTTKRDRHTGEEIGTGLGMWILATTVKNNGGSYFLPDALHGFAITILFPIIHH